jgi:hypothetical protein
MSSIPITIIEQRQGKKEQWQSKEKEQRKKKQVITTDGTFSFSFY